MPDTGCGILDKGKILDTGYSRLDKTQMRGTGLVAWFPTPDLVSSIPYRGRINNMDAKNVIF
jgi:hypothetical protein